METGPGAAGDRSAVALAARVAELQASLQKLQHDDASPEAEELLDEGSVRVADAVRAAFANGIKDVEGLEREVRRAAGRFVSERTRRRPMIVPVVMEV